MRTAGILLPLSSLPSPYGIGAMGQAAHAFIDFLAAAGQTYWQVLPVGPTGYGDSPYQSFSAFAGNPYFIDLDFLREEGLLRPGETGKSWGKDPMYVDYGLLFRRRFEILALAVERQDLRDADYLAFCRRNWDWLQDYALFMAIKEAHGQVGLEDWPEDLRYRKPGAMQQAQKTYARRVDFWCCIQYFFYRQWQRLKQYANNQGIELVGDIPIYVSPDSSDLWANPELFQTDPEGNPAEVAGVPPDGFSKDGQLWGNPLYNWQNHKKQGYHWWLRRLQYNTELYDVIRIDHFRGFCDYYAIPAGAPTAATGAWRPGPGKDFIRAVKKNLPDIRIIAEDLGFLTDEVRELLAYSGYPGMKILQFAFGGRAGEQNDYQPHNYHHHTVVYTGTHDNPTTEEWQRTAGKKEISFCRHYLGLTPRQNVTRALVRTAMGSVADTAILPIQDWLGLGGEARVNTPATLGGNNWRWRLLPGQLTPQLANVIREQTVLYSRLSRREQEKETVLVQKQELATALEAIHTAEQGETNGSVQGKNAESHPKALGNSVCQYGYLGAKMRILTATQMRQAEADAVAGGASYEQLMENAGIAAATAIEDIAQAEELAKSLLLLCGKGNNAGDAFVVARLLAAKGWSIQAALLLGQDFSPLARLNHGRVPERVAIIAPEEADFSVAILVDGVFGTGFHGALPAKVATALRKANAADAVRVALDLPSGLDCDTGMADADTFRADHTITFGAVKPGLVSPSGAPFCGRIQVADIGL